MRAIVLCAGYGTRLGALTRDLPKPMLPVAGRPLLFYTLSNLAEHGFDEIAINLHYKPDAIRDYFGDGGQFGLRLTYSVEPALLGTAGAIKQMEQFLRPSAPFLVHYGDVVTDQDLTALVDSHRAHGAMVTILVHRRQRSNSVVCVDEESRVVQFRERPGDLDRLAEESHWVNSGVYVFDQAVLDAIPAGKACDLPRDIFPALVASDRMFSVPLTGYRCAVDSPERLAEAASALAGGRLSRRGLFVG